MHESLWSKSQEPTIAGLYHIVSASGFVGDAPQIFRNHVEAKLSDGSIVPLFAYQPDALAISSEELIGLTVMRAVALAKSRGLIDSSGRIPHLPLPDDFQVLE